MVQSVEKQQSQRSAAWVLFALVALCLFACSNFLVACVGIESLDKEHAGYSAAALRCLAPGLAGLIVAAVTVLRGNGHVLRAPTAASCVAAGAGVIVGIGEYAFSYGLASNPMNAPFINAILPLNAVVVGLLSLFVLGERMTLSQVLGLAIAVAGLAMMGLANVSAGGLDGLGFGVLTMALFGCMFFGMKLAGAWGAGPLAVIVRVWVLYGAVGLVGLSVMLATTGEALDGLGHVSPDWAVGSQNRLYLFAIAAGVVNIGAIGCTKLALKSGPGGPVTAIVGSSSVLVFLLEVVFFPKPSYEAMEVVGLAVALLGVAVLSGVAASVVRREKQAMSSQETHRCADA